MTGSSSQRRPSRFLTQAAIAALAITGAVAAITLADPSSVVFYVTYAGTGAFLVIRRPHNSIGWLLAAIGSGLALGGVRVGVRAEALAAGALDPIAAASAWANAWGWSLAFVAIFGLTLVFPSGRMPAGRGSRPSRIALGTIVGLAALMAVGPTISVTPVSTGVAIDVPNPLALAPDAGFWALVPGPTLLYSSMFAIFAAGVAALIVRFRRSTSLERLQYRWLVAAIALVAMTSLIWAVASFILLDPGVSWIPVVLAYPTVPIAIVIAVLHYRLYEIDRIVSRTISWAIVTAGLVAVFAGAVVALQAVLAGITQGQTLAVAASTLVAAALFQPVRRRVQSAVDRRFDRARYDAQRTVDAFAEEVRNDVDLAALRSALRATADDAVRPASTAVWLRAVRDRREAAVS